MNPRSLCRRAFPLIVIVGLISLSATGAMAAGPATPRSSSGLSGKWSGTYGGTYQGTFSLHWTQTGAKLHGLIKITYKGQSATTTVTGKVNGSAISFGAVGPAGVVTYTGSVSGSSMSGTYTTRTGSGTWSAQKSS